MKVGSISNLDDVFSYKSQRFSEQKYILSVRDNRFEKNVIPIVAIDNGKLIDLDEFEFSNNIFATRPPFNNTHNIEDLPLTRFYKNQLVKINFGTIVENVGADNPLMPKLKTFNENINSFEINEIVEFFEGKLNESSSLFTPIYDDIFELIKSVYIENNNPFFIIENEKLIGPFLALKVNESSFQIVKSTWMTFGEYYITETSHLECNINDLERKLYINNCSDLKLDYKKQFDFLSDEDLINQFEFELKNNPNYFNAESIDLFKKITKKASELSSLEKIVKDNNRLQKLLADSEKILDRNINLINILPDIKKIKEEKLIIEENIFESKRELDLLKDNINNLKEEISNLEEIKKDELEKNKLDLHSEIAKLEERKNNLEIEIDDEKKILEDKLEIVKKDIEKSQTIEEFLKASVKKLQEEFTTEQKDAQYKLAELVKGKTHFDFISGRDLSLIEEDLTKFNDYSVKDQFTQYKDFRNEVVNIMRQHNRIFETHFVDNLLISIFQNTLTVFAGVPGTGKTSLARILTSILSPKDKIREVSVNRGWSSQKDLVGFVNPLTKRFHSSSTDIYPLLKQLNYETENNIYLSSPMSFIILDEANLSPLEHYWSSFYNLTDSLGVLSIQLGHNENIKFPNNLRFIGTINYDQTTEELSPRVLDRTNIIQLEKSFDLNFSEISKSDIVDIKLSFEKCINFFELNDFAKSNIVLNEEIEQKYREVKNEFKKLKIFISPRVEIGIRKYVSLATKYMSDVNKPLDYCISQRLLPLINLHGSDFKQKLELLKEKLIDYKCDISVNILEDIITIGSERGLYEDNFNYFLTLSNV